MTKINRDMLDSKTVEVINKAEAFFDGNYIEKPSQAAIDEFKKETKAAKEALEREIRERRSEVAKIEESLQKREESFEKMVSNLDKRERMLDSKENKLQQKELELEETNKKLKLVLEEQEKKLFEISSLTAEQAQERIMSLAKEKMRDEVANYMRDEEEKAKETASAVAKDIISLAIEKYSSEVVNEKTVSVVTIPNEEMKGRIIGREGRNIRTIEALTGVDLIIDDTPEAIVLSSFDPIRRMIAKNAIEALIDDGRIHPARIEEIVDKSRNDVENFIREKGSQAVFELGIGKIHPDLIKLIGKLHFRTSYGQNVLKHSIETAYMCGKMASQLGENEILAKRAGLLHDIGKAIDHEIEGSHVEIGLDIARKYKEPAEVIDGIGYHHGDHAANSIIAVLVSAADTLSAARPGARSESLENYIKRLAELENISREEVGVEEAYALQAGRELRVMVKSDVIEDSKMRTVARNIKEKIEKNLTYPGTVRVTVIRETRAFDTAK